MSAHDLAIESVTSTTRPYVEVIDQQGTFLKHIPLTVNGLSVGRSAECQLQLDNLMVARFHLQIDWNGQAATIHDLGTRDGTWLGDRRLASNERCQWDAQQPVRIGGFTLRLHLPAPPPISDAFTVLLPPTSAIADLTPGQPHSITVIITNHRSYNVSVEVSVEGIPATWLQHTNLPVLLAPGTQMVHQFTVNVPPHADSLAGSYEVLVRARALGRPQDVGGVQATWIVLPLYQLELHAHPAQLRQPTSGVFTVSLLNQSNQPITVQLQAEDEEQALDCFLTKATVELAPNQHEDVSLVVSGKPALVGTARRRSIEVTAQSEQLPTQRVSVVFEQPARLSPLGCLGLLVIVVLGTIGIAFNTAFATPNERDRWLAGLFATHTPTVDVQATSNSAALTQVAEAARQLYDSATTLALQAQATAEVPTIPIVITVVALPTTAPALPTISEPPTPIAAPPLSTLALPSATLTASPFPTSTLATATLSPTSTLTPTLEPTFTPEPTATPPFGPIDLFPTATLTPTLTPTPSQTPSPTRTPTP